MSAIAEISLFPMDKGVHLGAHVARAVEVIRESGLSYRLGPMGTSIEGEWDEVLGVIDRCVRRVKEDSERVYCVVKIDLKSGIEPRMDRKMETAGAAAG